MSSVAVAIPCLNEGPNLELVLPRVHAAIRSFKTPAKVYIVDGGSTDDTVATAKRLGAEVIQQRGSGYGGAIKTAFEDIDADYIITHDADCSHPPELLPYLYEQRDQAEIVIASRYVPEGRANMPVFRGVLSRILNATFRTVLDMPVRD